MSQIYNLPKIGDVITKVWIYNRTGNDMFDEASECQIFLNGSEESEYRFVCNDIDELEDENVGIYELQEDGTYKQIEDWQ